MSLISGRRRSATIIFGANCVLIKPRRSMNRLINSVEAVKREIDQVFILRAIQTRFAPEAASQWPTSSPASSRGSRPTACSSMKATWRLHTCAGRLLAICATSATRSACWATCRPATTSADTRCSAKPGARQPRARRRDETMRLDGRGLQTRQPHPVLKLRLQAEYRQRRPTAGDGLAERRRLIRS